MVLRGWQQRCCLRPFIEHKQLKILLEVANLRSYLWKCHWPFARRGLVASIWVTPTLHKFDMLDIAWIVIHLKALGEHMSEAYPPWNLSNLVGQISHLWLYLSRTLVPPWFSNQPHLMISGCCTRWGFGLYIIRNHPNNQVEAPSFCWLFSYLCLSICINSIGGLGLSSLEQTTSQWSHTSF